MKTAIIIPAYNEERTVQEVVRRAAGQADILFVIDDGSTDTTAERARALGAIVVSHCINRGLGAAIATGLEVALRAGADAIITLDADMQHDPAEVSSLLEPIRAGKADVVIGSRLLSLSTLINPSPPLSTPLHPYQPLSNLMPPHRRLENFMANMVTLMLFGVRCTDSQSGFRAFSRRAAELIQIETDGMEVSSEILRQAKLHGLRLVEVPIAAHYSRYSLSKGQSMAIGVKTAWRLLLQRLKY